jgi:hypothetical protein
VTLPFLLAATVPLASPINDPTTVTISNGKLTVNLGAPKEQYEAAGWAGFFNERDPKNIISPSVVRGSFLKRIRP